jgi:hypothetical protein
MCIAYTRKAIRMYPIVHWFLEEKTHILETIKIKNVHATPAKTGKKGSACACLPGR